MGLSEYEQNDDSVEFFGDTTGLEVLSTGGVELSDDTSRCLSSSVLAVFNNGACGDAKPCTLELQEGLGGGEAPLASTNTPPALSPSPTFVGCGDLG